MRTLILICLFQVGVLSFRAQNNWQKIAISPSTTTGISKLIVRNNCIYVFNRNHSSLLRSRDAGASWQKVTIPSDSTSHEYIDICFVNDSTGYLVGYDGSCYSGVGGSIRSVIKTSSNYGDTWELRNNGLITNSILTNINFFNEAVGVAFGTAKMQAERFLTLDGGLTWNYADNFKPELPQVNAAAYMGMHAIVTGVGHYLHLAVSQDQGSTWQTRHFHGSNTARDLQFFNPNEGVVIADDSIYFTDNAALTFYRRAKFPYSKCLRNFAMLDMNRGFFGTDHAIYYTADAGTTWELSYSNPSTILEDLIISGSSVYASTCAENFILKLDASTITTTAENKWDASSVRVYPNPANTSVNVKSTLPITKLYLLDVSGKLLRELKQEGLNLSTDDLQDGLYFLQVETPSSISTHKLLIQH